MYLSDVDIKKLIKKEIIKIEPPVHTDDFRPCGVRIHLSNVIYELNDASESIDLRDNRIMQNQIFINKFYKEINLQDLENESRPFVLEPGKMILGSTKEKIKMPNYMVGFIDGRSTVARFGITNNITASVIDNMDNEHPKNITLEIANCGSLRFVLYPNLPIGMLLFSILSSRTDILPSGQYADDQLLPNLVYTHEKKILGL